MSEFSDGKTAYVHMLAFLSFELREPKQLLMLTAFEILYLP